MLEGERPCTFPPCSRPAVVSLRLLVERCESVLTVCQSHAEWLRSYMEKDVAVRLVDELDEFDEAWQPIAEDDADTA